MFFLSPAVLIHKSEHRFRASMIHFVFLQSFNPCVFLTEQRFLFAQRINYWNQEIYTQYSSHCDTRKKKVFICLLA